MKCLDLYTDGACSGNPGPGGWGAVLVYNGIERGISGGMPKTTNNHMELLAVIEGLKLLNEPCIVKITSDSKYVVDSINKGWLTTWLKTGNIEKRPNKDLWKVLNELLKVHKCEFVWIKGHAGHPYNEMCDRMAVAETNKYK